MAPAKPGSARPTIHTVAERAGVSKSLVSLVLQGSASVSPEKRAAVQKAMEDLGYRPSATARRLRERRSRAVAVLVTDLRQPWYIEMVEGLTSVLAAHGLHLLLGDARLDREADGRLTRTFLEMGVDGLVLAGSQPLTQLIREFAAQVPTVSAGSRDVDLEHVDVVANDDSEGGALATRHLVELGHRRIACIAGVLPEGPYTVGRLRREGYEAVMAEAGLAAETMVIPTDITEEGGYRTGVRLLSSPTPPTAIVCANDLVAAGVQGAAREMGVAVPGALSIVGYDNTYLASLRSLWLTSIDGAAGAVGRAAGNELIARMGEPDRPSELVLVPPSLLRRGTTAPPAAPSPATPSPVTPSPTR